MQSRSEALALSRDKTFDVAVLGGGIVGAGIAQNAAARGLSVILIDKSDFSSGTSSKTTKLIHGGLRYLERRQWQLARELCRERGILEQVAPHLVKNVGFVIPIGSGNRLFGLKAQLGLTIYDLLAVSAHGSKRHQKLNQKEVIGAVPSLASNRIAGGLRFHDCVTDDSRLVMEVIKSAEAHSAVAINYVAAQAFEQEGNRITGVSCRDRSSGQDFKISCLAAINATGVWSDSLMEKVDASWQKQVRPAKGIHIMLRSSAFETNSAILLPAGGGRFVFVVPWQRALMVGTTDTGYEGSLEHPLAEQDEIDYLLDTINAYIRDDRKVSRKDVIAAWAGLRPLVAGKEGQAGKTCSLSREHEIIESSNGLIAAIGGQLTNYRTIAEQAVNRALTKLPHERTASLVPSGTDKIMLGGWVDKDDYLTTTAEISARARKVSVEPATIDHLLAAYGKDALKVIDLVERDSYLNKRICPDFPPIMAEVVYAVKHEMALCLEDILFRRLRLGLIHQGQCLEAAPKVARCVQGVLGWDENRTLAELKAVTGILEEHLDNKAVART